MYFKLIIIRWIKFWFFTWKINEEEKALIFKIVFKNGKIKTWKNQEQFKEYSLMEIKLIINDC